MNRPGFKYKCPAGHQLRSTILRGQFEARCDGCGKTISIGSSMARCSKCDYDICQGCFSGKALTPSETIEKSSEPVEDAPQLQQDDLEAEAGALSDKMVEVLAEAVDNCITDMKPTGVRARDGSIIMRVSSKVLTYLLSTVRKIPGDGNSVGDVVAQKVQKRISAELATRNANSAAGSSSKASTSAKSDTASSAKGSSGRPQTTTSDVQSLKPVRPVGLQLTQGQQFVQSVSSDSKATGAQPVNTTRTQSDKDAPATAEPEAEPSREEGEEAEALGEEGPAELYMGTVGVWAEDGELAVVDSPKVQAAWGRACWMTKEQVQGIKGSTGTKVIFTLVEDNEGHLWPWDPIISTATDYTGVGQSCGAQGGGSILCEALDETLIGAQLVVNHEMKASWVGATITFNLTLSEDGCPEAVNLRPSNKDTITPMQPAGRPPAALLKQTSHQQGDENPAKKPRTEKPAEGAASSNSKILPGANALSRQVSGLDRTKKEMRIGSKTLPFLLGSKGANLRNIENKTNTKVTIDRSTMIPLGYCKLWIEGSIESVKRSCNMIGGFTDATMAYR